MFDDKRPLRPVEVYQTAIQMMYDLAQRSWTEHLVVVDSKQFGDYNVLILFINPQKPTAPRQMQTMHCVAALYRSILMMTDAVMFCLLRSHLYIQGQTIASMSITPIDDATIAGTTNASGTALTSGVDERLNSTSLTVLGADRGQIKDPLYPSFTANYYFYGKSIPIKAVSVIVLEAMAAAAPYSMNTKCPELTVLSADGGAAILIDSVVSRHEFTYKWVTRALKILYQLIVMPLKRFGDVYLELRYNDQGIDEKFGELRMLRTAGGRMQNDTDVVANER